MSSKLHTAVLLAIGLLIHIGLSVFFVQLVAPDHDAWVRDEQFLTRLGYAKVVVAGGSHPRMAVRPGIVPTSINIATAGEHYVRTYYRLKWLLDRYPDGVETVLLDFDAGSFSGFKTDDFGPELVWSRYVPYLELGRKRGMLPQYSRMWAKAKLAPYVGEGDTIGQWATASKHFRRRQSKRDAVVVVERQTAEEIAARHFPDPELTWDPRQLDALNDLIAMLRERGLRVVLVTYPAHPAYLRWIQERGVDLERRDALLDDLLDPGKVDHLDYEEIFEFRPMFADPDHLSQAGATRFSRKLATDLVTLGVLPFEK